MKRKLILLLASTLTLGLIACGNKETADVTVNDTEGKAAIDILVDTWESYEEDEKFAIAGGDYVNMTQDAPGSIDTTDSETLDSLFGFPADKVDLINDGASMMHMMNQNNFTAGIYHVVNADDVQTVADALKENIMKRQWICGFPDDLVVYSVGTNYVVAVFGAEDIVDNFEEELKEAYTSATIIHDENLV